MIEYFRITIGYKDLYGETLSLDEAELRLAQYPLEQVLRVLGTMDALLSLRSLDEVEEGHRFLFGRMLTGKQQADVMGYIENQKRRGERPTPPFILFHELQIQNAVKLAILSCTEAGDIRDDLGPLIEAMLIINDHLVLPPVLIDNFDQLNRDQQRELLIQYFVPNAVFHKGESLLNLITRWHDLFFVDAPSLSARPDYMDLRAALASVTGMNADLFYWIGSAFVSYWMKTLDQIISDGVPRLNPREWFRDMMITPEEYGLVLDELGGTTVELREELQKRPGWEPYYFLPLQRKPLLRIGDFVYCLSRQFLAAKLSSGLYHLLLTGLPLSKERDKFLSFFGCVFESYVIRLLGRVFPDTALAKRYFANPKASSTNTEVIDAILDYGDTLVLIEAKATLFALAALVSGDATEIERKLDDLVYDAAKQLDAAVRAIKSGELDYLGINPERIKKYFPVVVSLQFFPAEPLIYKKVHDEIAARGFLQSKDIAPLQIAHIEDLERLETALTSGRSLAALLWDKVADDRLKVMTFGNFLIERAKEIFNMQNPYLLQQFEAVTGEMTIFFKSREKPKPD